jgi:hypothetical protein
MARTNPRTWTPGELVTAAMLNTEIKNNLNALWPYTTKGDLGVALSSDTISKLGVGVDGTVLTADSSQATGMKWAFYLPTTVVEVGLNGSSVLTTSKKAYFRIPSRLNTWKLSAVAAMCKAASSSGIPTFTIKNGVQNMLTTNLTIDQSEFDSSTAATPAVIDTSHNTVATADQIEVACSVAGTGVTYVVVQLEFSAS